MCVYVNNNRKYQPNGGSIRVGQIRKRMYPIITSSVITCTCTPQLCCGNAAEHIYDSKRGIVNRQRNISPPVVPVVARPFPLFRRLHQPAPNGIVMTVAHFLTHVLDRPAIVIVAPSLPEHPRRARRRYLRSREILLCRSRFDLPDNQPELHSVGRQHNQMDMVWHQHVANDLEPVFRTRSIQLANEYLLGTVNFQTRKPTKATERHETGESGIIVVSQACHWARFLLTTIPQQSCGVPNLRL